MMVVSYKTTLGEARFIGQLDSYCKTSFTK
jgi:hypothetical protein